MEAALWDDLPRCAPQKVDATSRSNFFEPIFMVQPAENTLRSYPAIGWQLMPMDAWARPRAAVGIRNAWPQARMGSSLIVQLRYTTPIKLVVENWSIAGTRGMDNEWRFVRSPDVAAWLCCGACAMNCRDVGH